MIPRHPSRNTGPTCKGMGRGEGKGRNGKEIKMEERGGEGRGKREVEERKVRHTNPIICFRRHWVLGDIQYTTKPIFFYKLIFIFCFSV